jgi:hypothetical protein
MVQGTFINSGDYIIIPIPYNYNFLCIICAGACAAIFETVLASRFSGVFLRVCQRALWDHRICSFVRGDLRTSVLFNYIVSTEEVIQHREGWKVRELCVNTDFDR